MISACSLFPVPCSLFPVPCSLFPALCLPAPGKNIARTKIIAVRVEETIQMSTQLLDADENEALLKAIDGLKTELGDTSSRGQTLSGTLDGDLKRHFSRA